MLRLEQAFYIDDQEDNQVVLNRISQIAYGICRKEKTIIDFNVHFFWRGQTGLEHLLDFHKVSTKIVVVQFIIDKPLGAKNKGGLILEKITQAVLEEFPKIKDGWCSYGDIEAPYDLMGLRG